MQLYNYQDIINKQPIYHLSKKNDFCEMFVFKQFYTITHYDQRIEITLSESIQRFSTKDIYIQQKALFIINYIYYKAIVKENCSYSQQKVLFVDLLESYVYCDFIKLCFLELYLKIFITIFYAVIVLYLSEIALFLSFFIYLICLFILFIYQMFISTLREYQLCFCYYRNICPQKDCIVFQTL